MISTLNNVRAGNKEFDFMRALAAEKQNHWSQTKFPLPTSLLAVHTLSCDDGMALFN